MRSKYNYAEQIINLIINDFMSTIIVLLVSTKQYNQTNRKSWKIDFNMFADYGLNYFVF